MFTTQKQVCIQKTKQNKTKKQQFWSKMKKKNEKSYTKYAVSPPALHVLKH